MTVFVKKRVIQTALKNLDSVLEKENAARIKIIWKMLKNGQIGRIGERGTIGHSANNVHMT
jgi:hypothetical protein